MRTWLKIPLLFVAVHTLLLLLTGIAMLLSMNSSNLDGTIGFAMMCVTFYLVDYPIGVLLEASRPCFSSVGGWLVAVVFLYGVLGNAMWFCIGLIVRPTIRFLSKYW